MPSTSWPVFGSSGICPDMYSVLPARIACEYGPIAAGASGDWIACLAMAFSVEEHKFSSGAGATIRHPPPFVRTVRPDRAGNDCPREHSALDGVSDRGGAHPADR